MKKRTTVYDCSIIELDKHHHEKGNIHALAKAMHELLDNPELRKERSVKGIKRAKEMFVFEDEEIRISLLKGYNQAIKAFNDTK